VTLRLDTTRMTATLLRQDQHRPPLLAALEGSCKRQPNGDELIGWGQQPYLTEFNTSGKIVFDARFVGPNSTYRAYRFDWHATPARPPDTAVRITRRTTTVYASWNGATQVVSWRVLAGAATSALRPVAAARNRTFETAIRTPEDSAAPPSRHLAPSARYSQPPQPSMSGSGSELPSGIVTIHAAALSRLTRRLKIMGVSLAAASDPRSATTGRDRVARRDR
jgi:hypothetical protein